MNYDKTEIPTTYDEARALAPETVRLWQLALGSYRSSRDVTGHRPRLRYRTLFRAIGRAFRHPGDGIDQSQKMLNQARRKPTIGNVVYWQGSAEALPLRDGCADLVFMSMVYHHLTDPIAVARECHRV
jgi:SAM-dependent methyltransferase